MKRSNPADLDVAGVADAVLDSGGTVCYDTTLGLEDDLNDDAQERLNAMEERLEDMIAETVRNHRLYTFAQNVHGGRGIPSNVGGGFDVSGGRRLVERIVANTKRANAIQRAVTRIQCDERRSRVASHRDAAAREGYQRTLDALNEVQRRIGDARLMRRPVERVKAFGDAAKRYENHLRRYPVETWYGGGGGGDETELDTSDAPSERDPEVNKYPYLITAMFPGAIPKVYGTQEGRDEDSQGPPYDTRNILGDAASVEYRVKLEKGSGPGPTLKDVGNKLENISDEDDDAYLKRLARRSTDVFNRNPKKLGEHLNVTWTDLCEAISMLWTYTDSVLTQNSDRSLRTEVESFVDQRNRDIASAVEAGPISQEDETLEQFMQTTAGVTTRDPRVEFTPLLDNLDNALYGFGSERTDEGAPGTSVVSQLKTYVKENRSSLKQRIQDVEKSVASVYKMSHPDASESDVRPKVRRLALAVSLVSAVPTFLAEGIATFRELVDEPADMMFEAQARDGVSQTASQMKTLLTDMERLIANLVANLRRGEWIELNSDIRAAMNEALTYLQTNFPNTYRNIQYADPIAASSNHSAVIRFARLTALMMSRHQLQFNASGYSQLGRTGQINSAIAQAGLAMGRMRPRTRVVRTPEAVVAFE